MKISKLFGLKKTQFELDFVDIDTTKDTPLFLDPYFISKCEFPFAISAYESIKTYFDFLLALLRGNQVKLAEELFSHLGENNDICLGMSRGNPRGRGMGPVDTKEIFEHLYGSRAMLTGIMEDIEDLRIFVPNVDKDKVSDMVANIIKKHLIDYTIEQCELYGIPLCDNVPSGMYWDAKKRMWDNQFVRRLVIDGKPILLVPKRIVSYTVKYTTAEYRQQFVLNYLQNEHLKLQTSLVQERKDKTKYVTKKNIIEHSEEMDKEYLARFTLEHPEVFSDFKGKTKEKNEIMDGRALDYYLQAEYVCKHLIDKLQKIHPGIDSAADYHNLIIGILELLLYPNLSAPKKECTIHEGRKRIDITYNNSSEEGFFYTLTNRVPSLPCPYVFVECKNYTGEVSNPELDQLSGRFSPKRGRVGILACRTLDSVEEFIKRCADTYHDDRGLILPISDDDLVTALNEYPTFKNKALERILEEKFNKIVFGK